MGKGWELLPDVEVAPEEFLRRDRGVWDEVFLFFLFLVCKFGCKLLEWQERRGDMDILDVNSDLESIALPADQKRAILKLIDTKINQDMKEVISEIRQLETRIQMTQEKHSNEIKTVYWVIGIAMAVILFVVARK
jgi:hypothetical protein